MQLKIGKILSVFECSIPIKIDVRIFLRTFCGTALAREREQDSTSQPTFVLFVWNPPRWYLLLSSLTLALFYWGWCPWHCQLTRPPCLCCECRAHDARYTSHAAAFVFPACILPFCWSWCSRRMRSGACICPICLVFLVERVTWLHGCVRHACLTAIDAPATIIVFTRWVLLCDSWHPHDALVLFVGEAALQLQDAVCCRGLVPCHVQGISVASALAPLHENGVDCVHRN